MNRSSFFFTQSVIRDHIVIATSPNRHCHDYWVRFTHEVHILCALHCAFRNMFILLPDRQRLVKITSDSSDQMFSTYHSYILLQTSPLITVHIYYMCSIPAALASHDKFVVSDTFPQYLRSWRPPPLLQVLPPKVCFVKSTTATVYQMPHHEESFQRCKIITSNTNGAISM